jgi:AcrR family transcriptional regulator
LGLVLVAAALVVFSFVSETSGYPLVAVVLSLIGAGMGLAMAPATESIMGSVPPEKAGVGSAMNDTTREIGGALGVAILGSITAAVYSSTISGDPGFASLQEASPELADAVKDSVGAASFAAAELPADVANLITAAANSAFIHALDRTVIVGAVVALIGAFIAFRYLPARSDDTDIERLVEGAAQRLPDDPEKRLGLAYATLGLLADAGMSSLSYNGIASQSGISTATLERYWGSRVDAVSDAVVEVFAAHPLPDTGDLRADLRRADLRTYLLETSRVLSEPRARQIIGALVSEAASDESLAAALRERVSEPRRRELETRLEAHKAMITVPISTAIDQIVGPIYYRTVITESVFDEELVDAVLDTVLRPNDDVIDATSR